MNRADWMSQGPYGVMVHWVKGTHPGPGHESIDDWNERVDAFDVIRFCDAIEATGAKWLIFPFGHVSGGGYFNSPNSIIERQYPGQCSRRDLSLEVAREITRRGIRFIAYMFTEWDTAGNVSREFAAAMDWTRDPVDKSAFQQHFYALIEEWAVRFGTLLSGWWFDGCYTASEKDFLLEQTWSNARFDPVRLEACARAGNPNAAISMCPGANSYACVFPEIEDYLSGEANDLSRKPESHRIYGLQWHVLAWIDCFWLHEKNGAMEPPRFTNEELIDYVQHAWNVGAGVTLNLGIYQDGTLGEQTLEQMTALRQACQQNDSAPGE